MRLTLSPFVLQDMRIKLNRYLKRPNIWCLVKMSLEATKYTINIRFVLYTLSSCLLYLFWEKNWIKSLKHSLFVVICAKTVSGKIKAPFLCILEMWVFLKFLRNSFQQQFPACWEIIRSHPQRKHTDKNNHTKTNTRLRGSPIRFGKVQLTSHSFQQSMK